LPEKLLQYLDVNKDLMQRIVKAETEIAQVQIDLWKEEQIKKLRNNTYNENRICVWYLRKDP